MRLGPKERKQAERGNPSFNARPFPESVRRLQSRPRCDAGLEAEGGGDGRASSGPLPTVSTHEPTESLSRAPLEAWVARFIARLSLDTGDYKAHGSERDPGHVASGYTRRTQTSSMHQPSRSSSSGMRKALASGIHVTTFPSPP